MAMAYIYSTSLRVQCYLDKLVMRFLQTHYCDKLVINQRNQAIRISQLTVHQLNCNRIVYTTEFNVNLANTRLSMDMKI